MFVVTGSTGQVGNALTKELTGRGRKVRALYRDEAKSTRLEEMGAEPFLASIEDSSALETAFRGAEGVFIMTPPFYKSHDPRNENAFALAALSHALQAAHVRKVVFLSSIGAQHPRGTGAILKLHDMENSLFALPVPAAAIRAAYFMENIRPLIPIAEQTGRLPVMTDQPAVRFPMVATRDIAQTAADLLEGNWSAQTRVELEGPEQYSMDDAAKVLAKKLGREITTAPVPLAQRQAFFEQAGFTPASAATMVEMSEGMASGLVAFEGDGAEHRRGTTSLDAVLGTA